MKVFTKRFGVDVHNDGCECDSCDNNNLSFGHAVYNVDDIDFDKEVDLGEQLEDISYDLDPIYVYYSSSPEVSFAMAVIYTLDKDMDFEWTKAWK